MVEPWNFRAVLGFNWPLSMRRALTAFLGQVPNSWTKVQTVPKSWVCYIEAFLQVFQSICLPERLEMVPEQLISGIQDKLGVSQIALVQVSFQK